MNDLNKLKQICDYYEHEECPLCDYEFCYTFRPPISWNLPILKNKIDNAWNKMRNDKAESQKKQEEKSALNGPFCEKTPIKEKDYVKAGNVRSIYNIQQILGFMSLLEDKEFKYRSDIFCLLSEWRKEIEETINIEE